ncbi:MAG: FAD-binding oxidoreductase [Candidatus Thorarchaeota archaeon]
MTKSFHEQITGIVGTENISDDSEVLAQYSGKLSLAEKHNPILVVWPTSSDNVHQIVKLANEQSVSLIPVSSGGPKLRGDTIPKDDRSVIINLSRMNKVIRTDLKNKVVMIEPGVTFGDLVKEVNKHGLRPLMPFLPKASKSVIAACLDREPVTIPRFHWDSSDPLLCTETVFGSGDLFRTGAAAGPGTIEEQLASGQAQKNPMGPSQFDPFRIIQGSQGTMGIVTWATIKCEILPEVQKIVLIGSDKLDDFIKFMYAVLKRNLPDDLFILNSMGLASALKKNRKEIEDIRGKLPEWILVMSISGHGILAPDELEYRVAELNDIAKETGVNLNDSIGDVSSDDVQKLLSCPSEESYWKLRFNSGCQEIFFLTTLDKTPDFCSTFTKIAQETDYPSDEIGVYIQPTVRGSNAHCAFDIYYNPENSSDIERAKALYLKGSDALLKSGAYFSRPYGLFTKSVFEHTSPEIITAMRKVKDIFDPNNVLNPGSLCFTEVSK